MAEQPSRSVLVERFLDQYDVIARRLNGRFKSEDLVSDALQETYLRLVAVENPAAIRTPDAFIQRVASNAALDQVRSRSRLMSAVDAEALLAVPDDGPDAETRTADREALAQLVTALGELPERRRSILMSARIDLATNRSTAEKFGVTTRTVEIELRKALEHCAKKLNRKVDRRFGPKASGTSKTTDESEGHDQQR